MPPKPHQDDASAKAHKEGAGHQGGKHPKADHSVATGDPTTDAAQIDKPHEAAGQGHKGGKHPAGAGASDGAETHTSAKLGKGGNQAQRAVAKVSLAMAVPNNPNATSLNRSPPAEVYIDGMTLGASIDAVTGEILGTALDVTSLKPQTANSSQTGDSFSFNSYDSYNELENASTFALTSSVTFPADGLSAGGSGGIDFSNDTTTSGQSIVYILEWERNGKAQNVSSLAKLSSQAKQELAKGYNNFCSKYGDYFVYSIAYTAKFTAVWKCTANSSSEINAFHASVNANVSAQSQLKGSGGFETTLQSAAKQYNVSVDVKYSTVGNAGKTNFDTGDPVNTLKNFQKVCQPAPATVLLRHYSQVDTDIPATIDMPPSVYTALSEVFSQANYLLLLNGLAPGNATTRMQRRQNLNDLIKSIHTARSTFDKNPGALKTSLSSLTALRDKLLLLLERQDLVAEQAGLTNADLIKMFPYDHQDADGTWVKSASGHHSYVFGKFTFTPEETKKYAIKIIGSTDGNGMGCKMGGAFLAQQSGAVVYPGSTGCDGVAVGIMVQDRWGDGTDGFWCIPPENPLGTKAFKILVKSEGSRGMDWGLAVAYIQTSDYDGST